MTSVCWRLMLADDGLVVTGFCDVAVTQPPVGASIGVTFCKSRDPSTPWGRVGAFLVARVATGLVPSGAEMPHPRRSDGVKCFPKYQ